MNSLNNDVFSRKEAFSRTKRLLGEKAMERIEKASVLLFGIGGVGSFAAEALVRSGIGHLTIVDSDNVSISNLNRQLHATVETIGRPKTEVMRERLLSINPECDIKIINHFYLPDDGSEIITDEYDYIIDAIDTVSAKIDIVLKAQKLGIPVISCMGTGNKLHPVELKVADIYETSVCPLCRVMRYELKKRGVKSLRVVYSEEKPIAPAEISVNEAEVEKKRAVPGSTAFVPPVAGMILASEVVLALIGDNE